MTQSRSNARRADGEPGDQLYEELVTAARDPKACPTSSGNPPHPLEGVPDLDLDSIAAGLWNGHRRLTTAGSPAVRHVSMDADDT
jgi:hypothetical protein